MANKQYVGEWNIMLGALREDPRSCNFIWQAMEHGRNLELRAGKKIFKVVISDK